MCCFAVAQLICSYRFSPCGGADDQWGSDEFMPSELLEDSKHGFLKRDGSIQLKLDMKVFGCIQGANYLDTQLLELIAAESNEANANALKNYVDNDVSSLIRAVTDTVDAGAAVGAAMGATAELRAQDRLVKARLTGNRK